MSVSGTPTNPEPTCPACQGVGIHHWTMTDHDGGGTVARCVYCDFDIEPVRDGWDHVYRNDPRGRSIEPTHLPTPARCGACGGSGRATTEPAADTLPRIHAPNGCIIQTVSGWVVIDTDPDAGRVAARDTLIQAACAVVDDWERPRAPNTMILFGPAQIALQEAVGVYRTGQTPEGNPT